MEDILKAAILGVIEGFTEFLPVSSTGHLILANEFVRFDRREFTVMFDIVIQLGAILAVAAVFWKRLVPWGKRLELGGAKKVWTLWGYAVVAFIPTGIGAFFFADFMETHLLTPWVVAGALIFYGVVFLFVEKLAPRVKVSEVENLGWKLAVLIGTIQLLSLARNQPVGDHHHWRVAAGRRPGGGHRVYLFSGLTDHGDGHELLAL